MFVNSAMFALSAERQHFFSLNEKKNPTDTFFFFVSLFFFKITFHILARKKELKATPVTDQGQQFPSSWKGNYALYWACFSLAVIFQLRSSQVTGDLFSNITVLPFVWLHFGLS